jgi:hypothetical protein
MNTPIECIVIGISPTFGVLDAPRRKTLWPKFKRYYIPNGLTTFLSDPA